MASQAFHALSLVAAARTAVHAARQVADRRAGRDASEQQDERTATDGLSESVRELAILLLRVRVRLATETPTDETAALVQAFEGRLVLDDIVRASRRAHQSLLSLYPAASEDVIEGVRRLGARAEALDPDAAGDVAGLAHDLSDWLDAVTA